MMKTQVDLSVPPQLQSRSPTQTNHSVPTGEKTLTIAMMIMTNAQETEVQKRASSSKLLVTPSYNFSSSILLWPPISIWTSLTAVLYYELKYCVAKKETNNN